MNIRNIIFMTLVAVGLSLCHPAPRHVHEPPDKSICRNHSVTGSNYVPAIHGYTRSTLRMRIERSQSGKISLSPQSSLPPYPSPDNSTKTTTNTTLPIQQPSSKIPFWIPTLESIITPIFRAVILILTLFNINITWRIHGQLTSPLLTQS